MISKELLGSGAHRFVSAPALGGDGPPGNIRVLSLYSDLWRNLPTERDAGHNLGIGNSSAHLIQACSATPPGGAEAVSCPSGTGSGKNKTQEVERPRIRGLSGRSRLSTSV